VDSDTLDHVALRASAATGTVPFVERLLGVDKIATQSANGPIGPVDLIVADGGGAVEFFAEGMGQAGRMAKARGFAHLAIGVDEVDESYARALRAGATSMSPPETVTLPLHPAAKIRFAFVYGPSGELIELIERTWTLALSR
jgi:glyoxylase I family protein